MELGIGGKHDEEEPILCGEGESRHVEYRVIRHGQPIERQHAQDSKDSSEENRHFKSHYNERRPGMIWLSAHIDGVAHGRNPVLHKISAQASDQCPDQHYQRYLVVMEPNRLCQSLHRKWAICIDSLVACFPRTISRCHQIGSGIKLGHYSIQSCPFHSLTSASGSRVRISKMEIMGRIRTNRNMAARNMPMVPM